MRSEDHDGVTVALHGQPRRRKATRVALCMKYGGEDAVVAPVSGALKQQIDLISEVAGQEREEELH